MGKQREGTGCNITVRKGEIDEEDRLTVTYFTEYERFLSFSEAVAANDGMLATAFERTD